MCILYLSFSSYQFLTLKYEEKEQIKTYIWDIYRKLILFLREINSFWCIIDHEIEGGVLGLTLSIINTYTVYYGNTNIDSKTQSVVKYVINNIMSTALTGRIDDRWVLELCASVAV